MTQFFLILALYMNNYWITWKSRRTYWGLNILFAAAVAATLSTTGMVELMLLIPADAVAVSTMNMMDSTVRTLTIFITVLVLLLLLAAFEVLQEAGLRLPGSIGQTVSILGGLVVGSAAVEARLVSPAVLVVVAVAGIAGYTMPSQDLAGALRLWRFALAVLAGVGGLPGVTAGAVWLAGHLAGLESFGRAYLDPFAGGEPVLRQPLPADKFRPAHLDTPNRRKQA